MLKEIQASVDYIKSQINVKPSVGIVLGSGLGNLATHIEEIWSAGYEEIPNFPVSTVDGHNGRLIIGKLNGVIVAALQGRFHYYEGYDLKTTVFPIRVFKLLGIDNLILSNASGGVNPNFSIGDIMIINDHINLFPDNPLRGANIDELGPRFPDMSEPYDLALIDQTKNIAQKLNIQVQEGVYVGLTGPNYETPAEYKFVRIIGGDTVGMSTVPEVIVAKHMNMKCLGFSIITDLGVPGKIVELSHDEVKVVAGNAEPKLTKIIKEVLVNL